MRLHDAPEITSIAEIQPPAALVPDSDQSPRAEQQATVRGGRIERDTEGNVRPIAVPKLFLTSSASTLSADTGGIKRAWKTSENILPPRSRLRLRPRLRRRGPI